ncbi:unnamed protein product [Peniophora sp. CBMAI 1063]|nr:unnamed protein product [Peniophora sp. CBMAI 1063]
MSGFNDYNTNTLGGGNSGQQKYETPYQTGNDANTMAGLGGDQSRTGYASSGAAGPGADNMNAGGFNDMQGSGGAGTGLGMMGAERTGRFSESQGYSTGDRDTSGFNTSSGGAENYGRMDPELSGGQGTGAHKASMMDKLRGTTEKVGGKMTGNPEMAARGEERKRGEL